MMWVGRAGVLTLVARAIPVLAALLTLVWLFWLLAPQRGAADWWTLLQLAIAVLLAFAVAGLARFAVGSFGITETAPPAATDLDVRVRGRIAPIVLSVGGIAIIALAGGLIAAIAYLASGKVIAPERADTLLMGVFTAVLPVFATWVGTVLAFYFTNESFRQAAVSAREAVQAAVPAVRVAERMIPYDKIGRLEKAASAARATGMAEVLALFNDSTTRVVVFDKATKRPLYVLRRRSPPMPPDWAPAGETVREKTVDDYLQANDGANEKDAVNFGFIAETATLDEARAALFRMTGSVDLFVTATGASTEPVRGWLPDDKLR